MSGLYNSCPRNAVRQRSGIAPIPSRTPAIPPATQAVVSVSSPSATAAFTAASTFNPFVSSRHRLVLVVAGSHASCAYFRLSFTKGRFFCIFRFPLL